MLVGVGPPTSLSIVSDAGVFGGGLPCEQAASASIETTTKHEIAFLLMGGETPSRWASDRGRRRVIGPGPEPGVVDRWVREVPSGQDQFGTTVIRAQGTQAKWRR